MRLFTFRLKAHWTDHFYPCILQRRARNDTCALPQLHCKADNDVVSGRCHHLPWRCGMLLYCMGMVSQRDASRFSTLTKKNSLAGKVNTNAADALSFHDLLISLSPAHSKTPYCIPLPSDLLFKYLPTYLVGTSQTFHTT